MRFVASRSARVVTLVLAVSFATVSTGCAHRGGAIRGELATIAIGDSSCALMTRITLEVLDSRGTPVPEAEVWRVETFDAMPPIPERAHFAGRTSDVGRLLTSHCYAGADELAVWQRRDHATRLSFLVLHEDAGYQRVTAEPPITDVYRDGDPGSRVGRPVSYGYELATRVELPGLAAVR